jgi:hypothetical protein
MTIEKLASLFLLKYTPNIREYYGLGSAFFDFEGQEEKNETTKMGQCESVNTAMESSSNKATVNDEEK